MQVEISYHIKCGSDERADDRAADRRPVQNGPRRVVVALDSTRISENLCVP